MNRMLVKLSGEALLGNADYGIDPAMLKRVAGELRDVLALGIQLAVVVGGGNIFRGAGLARAGMDRVTADQMGMLATAMNALALMDALESMDVVTRVQSAVEMRTIAEPFIRRRAIRHLEKGRVVILCGGTGNPFFTTDTAAALRANELGCDVLIKATKVDGIYDSDPKKNPDAVRFDHIRYMDALSQRLQVMDSTALSLCMDNKMPILVLNLWDETSLTRALKGERVGTLVGE